MVRLQGLRWICVCFALIALSFGAGSCKKKGSPTQELGGGVHGSVFAAVPVATAADPKNTQIVLLPDIEVALFRMADETVIAKVTTDYFGRYYFPHQEPGTYRLRWKAQHGWAEGTHPDIVEIHGETRYPLPAQIAATKGTGVIVGRIAFSDGSTPWNYDEFFSVDNNAIITVLDVSRTTTLAGPIHANATGLYAVAGLPRDQDLSVRAQHEASSVTRVASSSAVSFGGAVATTDLTLPNDRPEIIDLVPSVAGAVVKTAAPGDVITVTALTRDGNGDALTHAWKLVKGNGTISGTGATAQWTLPNYEGTYAAYVEVSDGRGGYAQQRINFTTALTHVTFLGRAVDKSAGTSVGSAAVTVNGTAGTTDANGFVRLRVPLADRYVLNIEKLGYALFSRVVDSPLTGQTWHLVKTFTQAVDPTQPIAITDRRPELEQRKLRGMRVRVPANVLVDPAGNKPTGSLTVHLATLDISDGEAPGDWGGWINGHETNLTSFGAGFVEFVDGTGAKYNLKPGASAEVEFTAPPAMLASAPANVPTWSYNPATGYWELNGSAVLKSATGSYVNNVQHFSTINTDLEKEDAACLGVMIYPPIPTGVKLRVKNPGGASFSQTFEFVLDAAINAVYRLPANTLVSLELLNADGTAYNSTVLLEEELGVPLAGNVVNTGAAIPSGQSLWPPEPYVPPCKLVILREANEPTALAFLNQKGPGTEAEAVAYYEAVDPNDLRLTLRGWWETNGFAFSDDNGNGVDDTDFLQPPDNAVRTSYLNDNDLGSGRDMYFLERSDGSVAAYVTNYGDFNQDHGNADRAANRDTPGATVCMEWSPVEGAGTTRIVKFFVYLGADNGPNAPRVTSANLDTFGEKYVPNLCNNCHGGSYIGVGTTPTFANINMGSSFRELDTATYKYPGLALTPDAAAKTAFKEQNNIVRAANGDNISVQVIKDLIDGWYAGGTDDQDNTYTPPAFAGTPEKALYQDVVRHSCRTCHVALETDINWTDYEQLKLRRGFGDFLKDYVLCETRIMPHAVITYRNFFLSSLPHRPAILRDFVDGSDWEEIGPCE